MAKCFVHTHAKAFREAFHCEYSHICEYPLRGILLISEFQAHKENNILGREYNSKYFAHSRIPWKADEHTYSTYFKYAHFNTLNLRRPPLIT